jgi:hypothetical protein
MTKIKITALAVVLSVLGFTHAANAWMPSGYGGWGTYRAWPGRGFGNWGPGVRYYGPGTYRPYSMWQRYPYYRY